MKDFLSKKNIINLLLLGIMVLAIPLTVKLARQQQILFSRAAAAKVEFLTKELGGTATPDGGSCVVLRNNKLVTLCSDVKVRMVAPTGSDIRYQQAQGRASLLPQGGFVSKVYAEECSSDDDCGDLPAYCVGSESYQCTGGYCDENGECARSCEAGGDADCENECSSDGSCDAEDPACEETTSGKDNCGNDCTKTGSSCGGGDGSKKGQRCDAGYNEPYEDGTVKHCTPGEYSDDAGTDELCKYDGDGDDAGPADANCDEIVSCPSGKFLNNNECTDAPPGGTTIKCYKCNTNNGIYEEQTGVDCSSSRVCSSGDDQNQLCKAYTQPESDPAHCPVSSSSACTTGSAGGITPNQAECVIGKRGNILPFYQSNGWCTDKKDYYPGIVNNWRNINQSGEDNVITSCGAGSSGSCTTGSAGNITADQANCVKGKKAGLLDFYKNNGWCTDKAEYYPGIVNNWKGIVTTQADKDILASCGIGGGGGGQKCFVCDTAADGKNRYRYAGTDGVLSICPSTATTCDPKESDTCKGADSLKNQLCNTVTTTTTTAKYKCSNNACVRDDTNGTYTSATCDNACSSTPTPTPTPTPPPVVITHYRFAQNPTDLENQSFIPYPQGGAIVPVTFEADITAPTPVATATPTAVPTPTASPVASPSPTPLYAYCSGVSVEGGAASTLPNGETLYTVDAGGSLRLTAQLNVTSGATAVWEVVGRPTGYPSLPNNGGFFNYPAPGLTVNYTAPNNTGTSNDSLVITSSISTTSNGNTSCPVVRVSIRPTSAPSPSPAAAVQGIAFAGGQQPSLGQKCVFVQFKTSDNRITERTNECINYAGPDPSITGAACALDIKDGSLLFVLWGANFGNRDFTNSRLAADNSNLEIKDWLNFTVLGRMANPPDATTGKTYIINLTRSDGVRASATCSVNTTQISLGAKLFCRAPSNFDQSNVQLTVIQNNASPSASFRAGSKARETVTITKEGIIQNLKTKLQEDMEYIICIKAPKSLRLCSNKFTAVTGNNIIQNFNLPVGDVNDDDHINSPDASICKAEWGPGKAGNKRCEFNRDNNTNSFEWSCLLHDFNSSSQQEPI